jgi:hypothetical protein
MTEGIRRLHTLGHEQLMAAAATRAPFDLVEEVASPGASVVNFARRLATPPTQR